MYKRIHGNFVHFAPLPISQVSGKLAHCVRSNSASNLPAMLTKWTKLPTECLSYMEEPFLLYWICHIKNAVLKYTTPSCMKTVYWFAPTFFIANNVESRRYAWQNKHLFENPWVGVHSVRTENHCLSMQSVRVWFAVLTIGDASPQTKDFLPNAHLSCVPVAFGP